MAFAFLQICKSVTPNPNLQNYKLKVAYFKLLANTRKFVSILNKFNRKPLLEGFKAILLGSKLIKAERQYREEKERFSLKFNETVSAKDSEIHDYKKRIEDMNEAILASKAREAEIINKIKAKEKHIYTLETQKADLIKNRKNSNASIDIRSLEEQLSQLQAENEELREKLASAEENVGSFLKDMSDLLDSHEASTALGSENNSFNYHEYEERGSDLMHRVRDNTSNYYSQPKETSSRTGGTKQTNLRGYPRVQQINYCYVEYNNPELNTPQGFRNLLNNRRELQKEPQNLLLKPNKLKEDFKVPDYQLEVAEAKTPKEKEEKEIQPRAVKKISWNNKDGSGPTISTLTNNGGKSGDSSKRIIYLLKLLATYNSNSGNNSANNTTMDARRGTRDEGNSNNNDNNQNNSGRDDEDDKDDDRKEFDSIQARSKSFLIISNLSIVLQEAATIQMSLRYILGLYKLHSIFLESNIRE